MSIKARPTILFATATALALSTCGATSSPSTPAASAGSSSAAASTDGSFTLLNACWRRRGHAADKGHGHRRW
ncbi:MAG: hypothetical protein E6Z81_08635 [Schaalia odontolytica]|nr:hypothetical protein [Schaalia odontolytica]MDU5762433.1 hypothetical protein [Schaalia odontolytica]